VKKYISIYSNNKEVTPAQYITEIICEHKAKKDNVDLHYKFWITKKWAVFYKNQIASAHKLIKQYGDLAIVRALKNPRASKIYSLRAPHLVAIIEEEKQKIDAENVNFTLEINRSTNVKFGNNLQNKNKKSIFSKLKDIDNEC
jgi:hypothetical protein